MVTSISDDIASWSCEALENVLLPVEGPAWKKTASYTLQFFQAIILIPVAATTSSLSFFANRIFSKQTQDSSLIAFAKHPHWQSKPVDVAPVDIGFASADFQYNGPQEHLKTNWGEFFKKHAQEIGDLGHMPDLWNHPEKIIEKLNELGCKKYRFSISRDKIEPDLGGPIDELALAHYAAFCRQLTANGIEPMITLDHFTHSPDFSWERPDDIAGFVRYCEIVCDTLYKEGVRKVITINEPTVVAFQGWVMGEFPPNHTLDFEGAAKVIENMMKAHTQVYDTVKAKHSDMEIGLTQDPIRFRHFHKANPLWTPIEKIICHYLTELNHSALMRCLQTGQFSLKVPFFTNYSFDLKRKPPLDFIGLQYYTDPLLQLSFTKGGDSVARDSEEQIMTSYQYRTYPQGLASAIEEFASLGVPVDITEVGIDIGINRDVSNDKERIAYFDRVFQVVQKALDEGKNVRSLYFWSLIDNLEWYKAWSIRFGFYKFDEKSGQTTARKVCEWLKDKIQNRHQAMACAG